MSVTPYESATGCTPFAPNITWIRRMPSGAGGRTSTIAGAICTSDAVGDVIPSWLLVSPAEGSAIRSVICSPPSARRKTSAARRAAWWRPGIMLMGMSVSGMSAYFLRREGRQHGLHRGVEQRIGEILQPHRVQCARLHIQRGIGLRVAHNLGASELHWVGDLRETRRVGKFHLVKRQPKR